MSDSDCQSESLYIRFSRITIAENLNRTAQKERWAELIESSIRARYGDPHQVRGWQFLCEDLGIGDIPRSINKCKKALHGTGVMINIVNLVNHIECGAALIKFESWDTFARYTNKRGRRYPRWRAKAEGFINTLLRRVLK